MLSSSVNFETESETEAPIQTRDGDADRFRFASIRSDALIRPPSPRRMSVCVCDIVLGRQRARLLSQKQSQTTEAARDELD